MALQLFMANKTMVLDRHTIGKTIIIILMVIHLLPVWCFQYFPTQDGASHIYNAYVLKEYHHHENYRLREVYELNQTLFPNWTSHVLLVVLMYVFPPIVCEKIVLSLCIALLPISLFYFLNSVQRSNLIFGIVGFIFAYNYLLHMGFYNFVLSMSLYFFTLGYWWKIKDNLRWTNAIVIYLLLILTYFTHYHSYALLLISLTFLSVFTSLIGLMQVKRKNIHIEDSAMSKLKNVIVRFKPSLVFIISLIPAYCILLSYYLYLVNKHGSEGDYKGLDWLLNYFFSMKSIVAFRDEHVLIGQILLLVFSFLLVITVINRVRNFQSEFSATAPKHWLHFFSKTDGFLILSVIVCIMFFILPWSGYSGGWINDRFHIYIFLIVLPFLSVNIFRKIHYVVVGAIIGIFLLHLGYNVHTYAMLNQDINEALSLDGMDERHTVLSSMPGEWNGRSDALGFETKYVEPFGHLECLLATNRGIAYLNNYEANTDHFPLQYKNKDITADYIIVWKTEYDDTEGLEQEYDRIDSNNYNRLYRRKQALSDTQLWKATDELAFDMQPHDAKTAPGHIPIYTDTLFSDGLYGWMTQSVKDNLYKETDILHSYQDGIIAKEDGVFRLTLPNGKYEVICYFSASESEPLEINLIANGNHKIKQLQMLKGDETVEKSYEINITDEKLTQVIYSRGKGEYNRWGWSGFTIQKTNRNR